MFDFLTDKFSSIFKSLTGKSRLTEQNLAQAISDIKDSLLQADVAYQVVHDFIDQIQAKVIGAKVLKALNPTEQFVTIVHDEMVTLLGNTVADDFYKKNSKNIFLMMGLQGSGKTTTIGKLAYFLTHEEKNIKKNYKILVASLDYYRPAAIEQLEIVARTAGVDFFKATATDPISAAKQIVHYFKEQSYDVLFVDTAGRLQVDNEMMTELVEIKKIINPTYSFMVLDAMTGQESLSIAQTYQNRVGFDGAILTKMDSQTKAGASFAFRYVLKKPIVFVGVGEKIDQLELFYPDRVVKRMLDMGDLMSFVEKAQKVVKQDEQKKVQEAFMSGQLTLDDFAQQLQMMKKMGSVSSMMKYIPGMGQFNISSAQMQQIEKELKYHPVILSSMTCKERQFPQLLTNGSRKKRIAMGAGVTVHDVNQLLQKFEETKQFAKLLKNNRFFNK